MTDQPPGDLSARQGIVIDDSDPQRLARAVELACDYRGDVTITRRSTGESISGFLFDRTAGRAPAESVVRIMPSAGDGRITIPLSDIACLAFSGRDTAEGKSFDTWMKKYVRQKLAGESASIESEPLEG
jgi:hypothetical protein